MHARLIGQRRAAMPAALRATLVAGAVAGLALVGWSPPLAAQPAPAGQTANPAATALTLIPAQSEVGFVVRQLGVPLNGRFQRFSVQGQFDPRAPGSGQIGFEVLLASVSLNPDADAELPKAEWFDAARFPKASFQSTRITPAGPGRFDVAGRLTIKGQSRDLVVPVQLTQAQGLTTVSGTATLRRLDFRIGDGEWTDTSIVANDVQVRIKLVLRGIAPL